MNAITEHDAECIHRGGIVTSEDASHCVRCNILYKLATDALLASEPQPSDPTGVDCWEIFEDNAQA